MRTALLLLGLLFLAAGVLWVGYGLLIGLGGGMQQARQSNAVLAQAIPGAFVLSIIAAVLAFLGLRREQP
jgi:hypothetical protein